MATLLMGLLLASISSAHAFEYSGFVGIESLGFFNSPLDSRQHSHYLSGVIQGEIYHEWDHGNQSIAFVPFFRLSQYDNKRTHFDIRELNWLQAAETWELRLGIRKEFWGVTEAQHLVDIINQTDLVENSDTEDKLGQPMINLALIHDWGTLDLFLLTGFRERTFPGVEGRPRVFPAIDTKHARFEKRGVARHLAYAVRWSQAIGDWDLGFSHFYGTGRDPIIIPEIDQNGVLHLIPYYETINQTGIDVQVTKGSWLWKLESIVRDSQTETFFAATGGFEYTLFDIQQTGLDLGFVVEYLYDSRGRNAQALFQDDILAALRFGFNDAQSTEILAGIIFDRTSSAKFYNIEASRRVGDSWKIELEMRFFSSAPVDDPSFAFREDDHVRAELSYHF